MKRALRIAILTLAMIAFLMVTPARATVVGTPAADSPSIVGVNVTGAGYADLDDDCDCDDIHTSFTINVYDSTLDFQLTYIYCFLVLPSGDVYYVRLTVIGRYSSLSVDLAWYNMVTESGWYRFIVYAEIPYYHFTLATHDDVTFDPPTDGNPGPPLVSILSVTASG